MKFIKKFFDSRFPDCRKRNVGVRFSCTRTRREEIRGLDPAEPMESAVRIVHVCVSVGPSSRPAMALKFSAESEQRVAEREALLDPGASNKIVRSAESAASYRPVRPLHSGEKPVHWGSARALYRSTVKPVQIPPFLKGRPVGGLRGSRNLGTFHSALVSAHRSSAIERCTPPFPIVFPQANARVHPSS